VQAAFFVIIFDSVNSQSSQWALFLFHFHFHQRPFYTLDTFQSLIRLFLSILRKDIHVKFRSSNLLHLRNWLLLVSFLPHQEYVQTDDVLHLRLNQNKTPLETNKEQPQWIMLFSSHPSFRKTSHPPI